MQHPHRRQNFLSGDWVLVPPHRVSVSGGRYKALVPSHGVALLRVQG